MVFRFALVLTALFACACAGMEITVVARDYVYEDKVGKQKYWLEIKDRDGELVRDLTRENLRVFQRGNDMGVEATKHFSGISEITIHVVLDVSYSMVEAGAVGPLVEAVNSFLKRTGESMDSLQIVFYTFDSKYRVLQLGKDGLHSPGTNCSNAALFSPLTAVERNVVATLVESELKSSTPNMQYTNLYGALHFVAGCSKRTRAAESVRAPDVVVLFTDGVDNIEEYSLCKTIKKSRKWPPIVAVGLGKVDREALRAIARKGMFFYAGEVGDLKTAFDELTRNIGFLWQFDFYPPSGRGTEDIVLHFDHPVHGQAKKKLSVRPKPKGPFRLLRKNR